MQSCLANEIGCFLSAPSNCSKSVFQISETALRINSGAMLDSFLGSIDLVFIFIYGRGGGEILRWRVPLGGG